MRRETVPVRLPMEGGVHEAVIVLLEDGGLVGLGEAPVLPGRGPSLPSLLAELRNGREPVSGPARFALETARLDLEGRRRGVSMTQLLGGARRETVECTALITAARPELVAREVGRLAAGGFEAFKLKSLAGGAALDLERLGASRWGAGRGGRLRIDFGGRLAPATAVARLRSLSAFRLEFAEQPLPADTPAETWCALAGQAGLTVAADESLADPGRAGELADGGIALAIKLAVVGGAEAALRLAARSRGPVTVGSGFETSIGLAAGVHAAFALAVEPLACGLATARLLDDDLAHGLNLVGSRMMPPDGSGLGVELDRKALAAYRVDR